MSSSNAADSRVLLRILFSVLFTVFGLASCSSGEGHTTTNTTVTGAPTSTIASVQAAWAATPYTSTTPYRSGVITHYCDCATGAEGSCVVGNNSTGDGSTSKPYQTIGAAITKLNSAANGETVALCKGGAFNATVGLKLNNSSCSAGSTCVDLREYTPTTFTGTAKPIINNITSGQNVIQGGSGFRVMNIKVQGNGTGRGLVIDNAGHDVVFANNDVDYFMHGLFNESANGNTNNTSYVGNHISNSTALGYLGGGDNHEVSYNYFENNGSNAGPNHQIYIATGPLVTNLNFIGNYIWGQQGTSTCGGVMWVGHALTDHLTIKDNYMGVDNSAGSNGCYGIALTNITANAHAVGWRHTVISGNTIINPGDYGIATTSCSDCLIENNAIIQTFSPGGLQGAIAPNFSAERGQDDIGNNVTVRNNSVFTSSNTTWQAVMVLMGNEGTGHVISNNTMYSQQSSNSTYCLGISGSLSAFTFIDNNICYRSKGSVIWDKTTGYNLSAWQNHTSGGLAGGASADAHSLVSDPKFTAAPTNLKPAAGSPLITAGNNTYKSTLDITGKTRPAPPAIGAYEP